MTLWCFLVCPKLTGLFPTARSYSFCTISPQVPCKVTQLRNAPAKLQKLDDSPVVPESTCVVDVNWLFSVACRKISEVERDYRRYLGVNDGYEGTPADVMADVFGEVDDIIAQEASWKVDYCPYVMADDRSVVATVLERSSKTVLTHSFEVVNLNTIYLMRWRRPLRPVRRPRRRSCGRGG